MNAKPNAVTPGITKVLPLLVLAAFAINTEARAGAPGLPPDNGGTSRSLVLARDPACYTVAGLRLTPSAEAQPEHTPNFELNLVNSRGFISARRETVLV
jgi:hypothetical protein